MSVHFALQLLWIEVTSVSMVADLIRLKYEQEFMHVNARAVDPGKRRGIAQFTLLPKITLSST